MAQRRKSSTEFVQNDKARLATFKRRSHCLMKKASELSTLCDVDVAVVIYADHLPDRPLVYPAESGESLRIIKKLKENPRSVPAAKSKPDKFLNQANHNNGPNDKFCDDITSLNVDELNSLLRVLDAKEAEVQKKIEAIEQRNNEAAVDEVSDPNRFLFTGNDHRSKLFDNQPHGFQGQIPFSVVDNEDSSKRLIKNNYGFLNQVSRDVNNKYNDEITSFKVGEAAVDETCDPNYFIFSGDDRHFALLDDQQDGFRWPISCSVVGEDNTTPKSKSERFTEENSCLWNLISGHPNNIHCDELMSLELSESDLAQIMDDMEEDEIGAIGEKSDHIPNCWNFPEGFSDEFSDPNITSLNADELNSLFRVLDAKEAEVQKKIEAIEQRNNEAAVDEVSHPNRFLFTGNDHRSKLFDNQLHGFQGQIPFSVVDNEDSSKRLIKNNYGFLNQVSGDVNNNYNDEITSFNVGEAAVDEICDPNYFSFSGDDRHSALLDDHQDGFQWPTSFSVVGEDNTSPKSKSERFTEENSCLWNLISGHPNNIHCDELMSLELSESDLAQIMDDMEEDEIGEIGEKSDHIQNCWNFPEGFSDEFSDAKCFFLSGGGWPNARVSESTKVIDFHTASSAAMVIPCSEKAEDTPISEPHHSIENNSGFLHSVAPISIVEVQEVQSQSTIVNQKEIETSSFTESSDFGSLAAIFSDEIPDVNGLFFNSENPMYHA